MQNSVYDIQSNTFIGGMNLDLNENVVKDNTYREAYNLRLASDSNATTGVLENVVGNRVLKYEYKGDIKVDIKWTPSSIKLNESGLAYSTLEYNCVGASHVKITVGNDTIIDQDINGSFSGSRDFTFNLEHTPLVSATIVASKGEDFLTKTADLNIDANGFAYTLYSKWDPSSIYYGDASKLTWQAVGYTNISFSINGINFTSLSGSYDLPSTTPVGEYAYNANCTRNNGAIDIVPLDILYITNEPVEGSVNIQSSNYSPNSTDSYVISWSTNDINDAYIYTDKQEHADGLLPSNLLNGSITLSNVPAGSYVYTIEGSDVFSLKTKSITVNVIDQTQPSALTRIRLMQTLDCSGLMPGAYQLSTSFRDNNTNRQYSVSCATSSEATYSQGESNYTATSVDGTYMNLPIDFYSVDLYPDFMGVANAMGITITMSTNTRTIELYSDSAASNGVYPLNGAPIKLTGDDGDVLIHITAMFYK